MNADDFRDYMLSFLFLRYLSGNYEESAKKELGSDYPQLSLPNFSEFRFISEKSPSNAVEKDLFSM
jgi:type I restriction enzyme M protein